ncbi:hypothetical protein NQ117_21640 [Paenibacillus sp. SC116]|uniref:hypothetical protein n=1 Tax=Paenibacillus sp. SC116 TaxID=2968986 RepID=UPI00215A63E5|nr:hypothetical protein [Paenibacillus sp. SC116]MCR8846292.1 hypothetical protein [Paenibacillus sp. SC116]
MSKQPTKHVVKPAVKQSVKQTVRTTAKQPPLKELKPVSKTVNPTTKKTTKSTNKTSTVFQGPYLNRFTVVWVQLNGIPFNTRGFTARAFANGVLIATAPFDRFGVVQFRNIGTPTNVPLVIRTFNANGVQFRRTRVIPAGNEAFAIIG